MSIADAARHEVASAPGRLGVPGAPSGDPSPPGLSEARRPLGGVRRGVLLPDPQDRPRLRHRHAAPGGGRRPARPRRRQLPPRVRPARQRVLHDASAARDVASPAAHGAGRPPVVATVAGRHRRHLRHRLGHAGRCPDRAERPDVVGRRRRAGHRRPAHGVGHPAGAEPLGRPGPVGRHRRVRHRRGHRHGTGHAGVGRAHRRQPRPLVHRPVRGQRRGHGLGLLLVDHPLPAPRQGRPDDREVRCHPDRRRRGQRRRAGGHGPQRFPPVRPAGHRPAGAQRQHDPARAPVPAPRRAPGARQPPRPMPRCGAAACPLWPRSSACRRCSAPPPWSATTRRGRCPSPSRCSRSCWPWAPCATWPRSTRPAGSTPRSSGPRSSAASCSRPSCSAPTRTVTAWPPSCTSRRSPPTPRSCRSSRPAAPPWATARRSAPRPARSATTSPVTPIRCASCSWPSPRSTARPPPPAVRATPTPRASAPWCGPTSTTSTATARPPACACRSPGASCSTGRPRRSPCASSRRRCATSGATPRPPAST